MGREMGVLGFVTMQLLVTAALGLNTLNPSCEARCGDVEIPCPVGVRKGCYLDDPNGEYDIRCDQTATPPKAYLGKGNIEVINISLDGQVRIKNSIGHDCYKISGQRAGNTTNSFTIESAQYTFSHTRNRFVVVGCDTRALLEGQGEVRFSSGCISLCSDGESMDRSSSDARDTFASELIKEMCLLDQDINSLVCGVKQGSSIQSGVENSTSKSSNRKGIQVGSPGMGRRPSGNMDSAPPSSSALTASMWLRLQFILRSVPSIYTDIAVVQTSL